MTGDVATKAPEVLSLQARFEQLEAAIEEAHNTVNRIIAEPTNEQTPEQSVSAVSSAIRCEEKMVRLNNRLAGLADSVGQL